MRRSSAISGHGKGRKRFWQLYRRMGSISNEKETFVRTLVKYVKYTKWKEALRRQRCLMSDDWIDAWTRSVVAIIEQSLYFSSPLKPRMILMKKTYSFCSMDVGGRSITFRKWRKNHSILWTVIGLMDARENLKRRKLHALEKCYPWKRNGEGSGPKRV